MLILKFKNRKGNSSIEYAFLIALVIGALLGMQAYLKRPICQRWRLAGDAFGFGRQYGGPTIQNPDPFPSEFSASIKERANSYVDIKLEMPIGGNVYIDIYCNTADDNPSITDFAKEGEKRVKRVMQEFSEGGIYTIRVDYSFANEGDGGYSYGYSFNVTVEGAWSKILYDESYYNMENYNPVL